MKASCLALACLLFFFPVAGSCTGVPFLAKVLEMKHQGKESYILKVEVQLGKKKKVLPSFFLPNRPVYFYLDNIGINRSKEYPQLIEKLKKFQEEGKTVILATTVYEALRGRPNHFEVGGLTLKKRGKKKIEVITFLKR